MLAQASLQVSRQVKPPTDVRSIVHTQLPQQAKLLPAGKLTAQLLQSFQHQQHPHVGHRLMMFNKLRQHCCSTGRQLLQAALRW